MSKVVRKVPNLTLDHSIEAIEAEAALLKEGLFLPRQPKHERPDLGDLDITSLGDEEITDLLVTYTSWTNWAATVLTFAEIDERVATRKVEVAEAYSLVNSWGNATGERVTIAKANRELDDTVQKMKQDHLNAYALRKLATTQFDSYERESFAVSREITRRGGGDAKQRRADKYSR